MLGAWLVGASFTASAKPKGISDAEMALIPKYCPDTMGFNYGDAFFNTSPRAGHWVGLMGKTFWAIHHYCWGLINLGRATRVGVPPMIRKGTLEDVRNDFQFVLDRAPPDFIMLPEILTRMGEVELLLKRPVQAGKAFARAREIKQDYWPAYSKWAEFLISSGKRAEAKDLIKSGLEFSPKTSVLIDLYRLLGGNPADIVPKEIRSADAAKSDGKD